MSGYGHNPEAHRWADAVVENRWHMVTPSDEGV
jgi:hypothetical protein